MYENEYSMRKFQMQYFQSLIIIGLEKEHFFKINQSDMMLQED